MPKRLNQTPYDNRKNNAPKRTKLIGKLNQGESIVDNLGKIWKLGKIIGIGGFGEIYEVAAESSCNIYKDYVAKIEKHTNGPLFVEINCYLRLGKLDMIQQWQNERNLEFLGMPYFVASGSHISGDERYRFLIVPKCDKDLESIFQQKKRLNIKTVLVLAIRLLDILEYIHNHGYIHSDIKASNIMLKYKQDSIPIQQNVSDRKLRSRKTICYSETSITVPHIEKNLTNRMLRSRKLKVNSNINNNFNGDHVYLLDYGLASKYLRSNGEHREFADERKAHAGTILFCSRDAHKGISSRRSDLESLAYNMIYWLTGSLPWIDDGSNPEIIERKKNICFTNIDIFLSSCFNDSPKFLVEMFKYISKLEYNDTPDYELLRDIFRGAIKHYRYTDDIKLDLDNLTKSKLKPLKGSKLKIKADILAYKKLSFLYSKRVPLDLNFIFKRPNLRKANGKLNGKGMHWSEILIDDPETMLKHQRKSPDEDRNCIINLDIESLNPTPAMIEVFNRAFGKPNNNPINCIRDQKLSQLDCTVGYTPEMMRIYIKTLKKQKIQPIRKSRRKKVSKSKSKVTNQQNNTKPIVLKKAEKPMLRPTYSLRGT